MKPNPIFTANINRQGKIIFDEPEKFKRFVQTKAGRRVEVLVRNQRNRRSLQANKYYWGVVIALMAEEFGYEKEELHNNLAMKFLRIEDCPITGSPQRKPTPDCDTKEFAEYLDACMCLGAEHGIYFPAPGEVDV